MYKYKYHLALLCLFILSFQKPLQAQKIRVVQAEYEYMLTDDITINEAKLKAVEEAKIKAIGDEFGFLIHQDNVLRTKENNETISEDFLSLSSSNVKGEWIEDLEAPQIAQIVTDDGTIIIKAKVKGKVREIVRADVDVQVKILRNGITAQDESDSFISGSDLYMLFQSPRNGFLTVYLLDEVGDAFCLLPYPNSPSDVFRVEKNKSYVLFHPASVQQDEQAYTESYYLTTAKEQEVNYIYAIFSPNEFSKASDEVSDELIPRQLSSYDFQKWLSKNRNSDDEMQVISKSIIIKQ